MGRKNRNARKNTYTPAAPIIPEAPVIPAKETLTTPGFQPPQTMADLSMMIKAMSAFYVKAGGDLTDLIPPQKIPAAPTIEEVEESVTESVSESVSEPVAEKEELIERKLTDEEIAELEKQKAALFSHNCAVGHTNSVMRRAAILQATIRGTHRHKNSPKFYEKINSEWVSGDTTQIGFAVPTWLYSEVKKKNVEIGRLLCALLAEAVGIDLSKVECSRSRYIDSPADKAA